MPRRQFAVAAHDFGVDYVAECIVVVHAGLSKPDMVMIVFRTMA